VLQVLEEEEEEQVLSYIGCFVWLTIVTIFISILSDYIMDAITGRGSRQLWGVHSICALAYWEGCGPL
jgi:hypothetical protein